MRFISKVRGFLWGTRQFRDKFSRLRDQRAELDSRLNDVALATLNGDTEWFMEMVKKDPACALKVAQECEAKNG
jgi:hypothetical protein